MDFLRKIPTQNRSKILVQSVLEATGRVIGHQGLKGMTVEKVSNTTGISVGSLYQYFRTKEDLTSGFIYFQLHRHHSIFMEAIRELFELDVEDFISQYCNLVFEYFQRNRSKIRYVHKFSAQYKQHEVLMKLRQETIEELEKYLLTKKAQVRMDLDFKLATTIVVHGMMGILEKTLEQENAEQYKDEAIQMIKSYVLA
ncbi:MAG: TetR/AcrR family transcriptional regulator [Pseudomonadota bacterium]